MNEEIFGQTSEQTEAPQTCTMPDPRDPFGNETEFRAYNSDYGRIVPQIRIPGCSIPLKPNKREKRRIQYYYNAAGGGMLAHLVISNILFMVLMTAVMGLMTMFDTAAAGGTLPENYETLLENFFNMSASSTALNALVYGACNVGVALIGLRIIREPVSNLFRGEGFNAGQLLCYGAIALFIQWGTGYISMFVSSLLENADITLYEADFSTGQDVKNIVMMLVYSCIVAPVTEELLFRGFFLKSLSRVSQRFGIFMSAFLFGIWHLNFSQFVLAFGAGLLMGYIAVKHNSIVPTILVHMMVNTTSEIFSVLETYGLYTYYDIADIVYFVIVLVGAVLLLRMWIRERMPRTTPSQSERGLRLCIGSVLMSIAVVCYIAMSVLLIAGESAA